MTDANTVLIADDDPVLTTEFGMELIRQMRATDAYGHADAVSNAKMLSAFILTEDKKRSLPVIGNVDARMIERIQVFYNTIAVLIEKECRLMATSLVHLNNEGFGRIVITVGKLVVLDKTVREAHRFGFPSLSKMKDEADKVLSIALELIGEHSNVAGL